MKNKFTMYLLLGALSLSLLGCSNKEEPTVSTEIEETVSSQEEVQQESVSSEESVEEIEETVAVPEEVTVEESTVIEEETTTEEETVTEEVLQEEVIEPITLKDSHEIVKIETQGVKYVIYDKIGNTGLSGAKCVFIDKTYILQEEIEYEGVIYPVNVFGGSSDYLKVTDYTIPEHIKYFESLGKMEVVNLTIPDTVEFINLSMPFGRDLITVNFPEDLECYSTQNWDRTFMWCYDIESITIPDGAKYLSGSVDGTFEGCDDLKEVILPNTVEIIGSKAFFGCSRLETLTMSDNIKQISDKAFYCCENLTSITLPDGLESIGKGTFEFCESLEEIIIPDSVTKTTAKFTSCKNLKKVVFPKEVEIIDWYFFAESKSLETIVFPLSATEEELSNLKLPDSIKTIEVPEALVEYLQFQYPNIEVIVREE